jgi:hypothetical protein
MNYLRDRIFLLWPARDLDAWLPDQWKLRQAARLASVQDQPSQIRSTCGSPIARNRTAGQQSAKE